MRSFVYERKSGSVYIVELNVGNWRDNSVDLYMGMESPNRSDIDETKQIFKSVKFLKSGCAE